MSSQGSGRFHKRCPQKRWEKSLASGCCVHTAYIQNRAFRNTSASVVGLSPGFRNFPGKDYLGIFVLPCPSFLSLSFTHIPLLAKKRRMFFPTLWTFQILQKKWKGVSIESSPSRSVWLPGARSRHELHVNRVMDTEETCFPYSPLSP